MSRAELTLPFAGSDITFGIEYNYHPGAPAIASGPMDNADPGYSAEIEFLSIEAIVKNQDHFRLSDPSSPDVIHAPVPSWLFNIIANDDEVYDQLCALHETNEWKDWDAA